MASLTGAPRTASPEPMVRSPDGSLNLRHPTPDLQSLQGAYVGNVERLERTAERMSTGGSELGEEIRKLQLEQKLADSRRSSIMSAPPIDPAPTTRSRNASTSSYSNSIVDVNNAARWGGYSPGGFVTSPIGSVRSSSFSQPGVKRHASVSRSTRLDQVIQPELEEEDPAIIPAALNPVPRLASPKLPAHRDEPSSQQYQNGHDAQGTHHDYFATGIPEGQGVRQESQEYVAYNPSYHPQDERTVQPRPGSAASGDTYHQAKMLFHDFDGVHFSPIDEHSELQQEPRRSTLIHPPHRSPPQGVPAPRDSMVYYPAPVPRMLNLPKRLSQLPSASVQAKRRTQQLDNVPAEARKSALWLSGERPTSHDGGAVGPGSPGSAESPRRIAAEAKRRTFQNNLSHLPPQLRASMFFDQQPPAQEVEVKGESAADTLDSILDASAHAPVGAFTDHPIAGRVGPEVYGKDRSARRSTISGMEALGHDPRKSRSSLNLNGIFARRESAGPGQMNKLQKRSSQLSLGAPLDLAKSDGELSPRQNEEIDQGVANNEHPHEGPQSPEDEEQQHQEGEEEDAAQRQEQQYFGPPTTLLAELQLRKQQQRTRNKAAATAFPNGMHATLLELDAVAEIEKKRRQGQRIALAWEDPAAIKAREEEEDEDADVPLGMLFPGRDGLLNKQFGHIANVGNAGNAGHLNRPPGDWDRPLGLYQKRELEDNEPLSRRRNRLKGVDPNRQPSPGKNINPTAPPPPPSEAPQEGTPKTEQEEEEEEGETLAQRIRRLKNEKALDSALEDVKARPVSTMFASELLSQFEADKDKDEKDKAKGEGETGIEKTGTPENEEETLGQRRARLQREALARGGQPQPQLGQMPLKQVRSMADLLAAHPAGLANNSRGITNEALVGSMPMGSLLQQNQLKEARHKREMFETNRRSSVFGLDKPLVDVSKNEKDWDTPLGLVGQSNKKKSYGSAAQMGIVGLHTQGPPQPQSQVQPQPQMGMGMGMGGMMGGMQQMQMPAMAQNPMMAQQMGMWPQQAQMNMGMQMPMQGMNGYGMYQQPAMAMSGMSLGAMPMPVTYAAGAQMQMQMPMGLSQEALMDPRQRDLIDRWRQSIM